MRTALALLLSLLVVAAVVTTAVATTTTTEPQTTDAATTAASEEPTSPATVEDATTTAPTATREADPVTTDGPEPTPVTADGSAAQTDEPASAPTSAGPTPAAGPDQEPSVPTDSGTAASSDRPTSPPTADEPAPSAPDVPAEGDAGTDPADGDEGAPPADGDESAPPEEGDETVPADGDESAPPVDGNESAPPADGDSGPEPAESDESAPPTDGNESVPPTDGDTVVDLVDGNGSAPLTGGNETALVGPPGAANATTVDLLPPGPIPVDGCTVITEPGTYRLVADLSAADADVCVAVAASDVHLDGGGHAIVGSGATGRRGVTHFGVAVAGDAADGHGHDGGTTLSNVTVEHLSVSGWTHGVHLDGVADATVADVTFADNRVGLAVSDGRDVSVRENAFLGNAQHGLRLQRSTGTLVAANTVADHAGRGVHATGGERTTVRDNDFEGNAEGVSLQSSRGDEVRSNRFVGDGVGVALSVVADATVRENDFRDVGVGVSLEADHETSDGADAGGHLGGGPPADRGSDGGDDHDHADGGDDHDHDDASDHADGGDDHDHEAVASVPGSVLVADNTFEGPDVAIRQVGYVGAVVERNDVWDAGTWAYADAGSARDTPVADLAVDGERASFVARNVAVGPVRDGVEPPDGYAVAGTTLNVSMAPESRLSLTVPVADDPDLDAVRLWRFDGADWALDPPLVWRHGADVWALDGANAVDAAGALHADPTGSGVVVPLAGPAGDSAVDVPEATLSATTVRQREPVTVTAVVRNDGPDPAVVAVDLLVDGARTDGVTVTLADGENRTVAFDLAVDAVGDHDVAVSGSGAGTLAVRPDRAPSADAGPNRSIRTGVPTTFDASASTDDVGIAAYVWDFGDGSNATGALVDHAFDAAGTYAVTLTVTDTYGTTATDEARVRVRDRSAGRPRGSVNVLDHRPVADVAVGADGTVTLRSRNQPTRTTQFDLGGVPAHGETGLRLSEFAVARAVDGDYDLGVAVLSAPGDAVPAVDAGLGAPLGYLRVSHDFADDTVASADVGVVVPRVALTAADAAPDGVALYRYHGAAWHRLPTSVVAAGADDVSVRAHSPGLSVFAVVVEGRDATSLAVVPLDRPTAAAVGDAVPVEARLSNRGSAAVTRTLSLVVDGTVVDTATHSLAPGDEAVVTFHHAFGDDGTYAVAVDDAFVGRVLVGPDPAPRPDGDAAPATGTPTHDGDVVPSPATAPAVDAGRDPFVPAGGLPAWPLALVAALALLGAGVRYRRHHLSR
ncbi:MAG: NosD domain-containing protein [Halobacteriaceae archaeon]